MLRVPIEPGITPRSPWLALMAPLRVPHNGSPSYSPLRSCGGINAPGLPAETEEAEDFAHGVVHHLVTIGSRVVLSPEEDGLAATGEGTTWAAHRSALGNRPGGRKCAG